MNPPPSILTNLAFHQSHTWRDAVTTICREDESPDDLSPLKQALRLLKLRRRYDVVVTMGARPSLAYGLLCGLLHLPSKQIMTEVFLDAPRPTSLPWRVKTASFRWSARRSLGILTNSSAEVGFIARRFEIPETKLRFVPLYTTIASPQLSPHNDGYVLSIGRTMRDIDTLLQAAPRFGAPLMLVVGQQDPLPAHLPPQVQVFRNIPLAEVHEKMRRAALVVIPLLPAERSTGQVVLFEAMALGKPVVATRATGTADYIRNGENGLLVAPGDPQALADAVNQVLNTPKLATQLSQAAVQDCKTMLHLEHHAKQKLSAVTDLWSMNLPIG